MSADLNQMKAKIPLRAPVYGSHGEMLFYEHQAGRISDADLRIMIAIHTADRMVMFTPLPYPDLPPVLREYATARLNGVRMTRDPEMHRRVGFWTDSIRKIAQQNLADVEFCRWISKYLEEKGMIERFLAVQTKIAEYEKNEPVDEDLANRVQTLDWKAKAWEGR